MPRDIAEQGSAINPRDSMDDNLALADRFGLSLGFHAIDQDQYLAIVQGHAQAHGLAFDPQEAVGRATRRDAAAAPAGWRGNMSWILPAARV